MKEVCDTAMYIRSIGASSLDLATILPFSNVIRSHTVHTVKVRNWLVVCWTGNFIAALCTN